TNLTQDHLDYHGSMDAYGAAKVRLFTEYAPRHSVIMVDQPFGRALAERVRASGRVVLSCSADPSAARADIQARTYSSLRTGIEARVLTPQGEIELHSPLFGAHNMENLLVVLGVAHALGIDLRAAAHALRSGVGAPG